MNSKYSPAYLYRGLCYENFKQDDKALADYQSAVNNSSDPAILKQAIDSIKRVSVTESCNCGK